MLKHMLNNNSTSTSNTERSTVKQNGSALNCSRTTLSSGPQTLHQPQDISTEVQSHTLRCPPIEPEYQNTRIHSPTSEFYRGAQFNKSVRSVENISDVELQPHTKRPSELYWSNRCRSGLATVSETVQNPRLPSRGSVLNHSYAGTLNPHPFTISQQQRHNQTDMMNWTMTATPPNFGMMINGTSPNFTSLANGPTKLIANGGLHIPKSSSVTPATLTAINTAKTDSNTDISKDNNNNCSNNHHHNNDIFSNGVKEILTSLGLLCLISLLLALLSLIFLLKISPVTAADVKELLRSEQFNFIPPDEYVTVYEVTLALCALSLSLNLCCLLVCSVQFLFAVKLTRSSINGDRTNKYIQKSAGTRVCAIAGFFISIPVFLAGVILYTFIQFHSTPAFIASVLIGSGIVFCGCALVHNVIVWQSEKTNAVKALVRQQRLHQRLEVGKQSANSKFDTAVTRDTSATALSTMSTLPPHVGVDLSSVTTTPHELSTLV